MQIESNRLGDVESTIETGEKLLEGVPDSEAAPIRAEFAAIRAYLATLPTAQEEADLGVTRGKIRHVQSQIAQRQTSGIAELFATAERHLMAVREPHRGKVAAELEAVRAEIAAFSPGMLSAPAPTSPAPPPPVPNPPAPVAAASVPAPAPIAPAPAPPPAAAAPLTAEDNANLSRGRSRVMQARSLVDTRRVENVDAILDEALEILATVPASATEELRAQIPALRAQVVVVNAADANRRACSELDRHLGKARSDIPTLRFDSSAEALAYVTRRLGEPDIATALSTEEAAAYRARVAEGRAALAAAIKADALDRANPLVVELEQMIATDPFAGLDRPAAYRRTGELSSLRLRILGAIRHVPEGDPEIDAITRRVLAADQVIDRASAAWGKAVLDAAVSSSWSVIERDIAGWESESEADDGSHLHEPALPLTRKAIQRIRYLLEDTETRRIRAEHRGDPTIEAAYHEAERVLFAAATKLNVAFNRVLDAAERMPTPLSRFVLDRPAQMAFGAESAFAGTSYAASNVARARKLDERWKAEVAAIMRARQALFDQLAAEAETTWPRLRDATGAVPFDPATARPGDVVRLDALYNRSGWDYASRAFGFAVNEQGVLIGGVYEPHVIAALEHAWYEQKLDVSDRLPWDLVGVVEGPSTIGVRTTVTLRDARTNLEIGTIEEWPPSACVRIRIIALHAGPVAVGAAP